MAGGNWIAGAIKRPGRLHRATGTPKGENIPVSEINRLTHSSDSGLAAAARMAKTLRKMNPWEVIKDDQGWWVVKADTREKVHKQPHRSREDALDHVKALYSAEGIGEADKKVAKAKVRRTEAEASPAIYRGA